VTSLPAETTQCIVVFLHQSTGGATAGCVSVAHDVLVGMLTWLDPARSPRIAMAPLDRLASL
jgi:L,D-peptidoglycan transpeptidase YkuD (ErfK/YbiS/YcfS/YnhG family)